MLNREGTERFRLRSGLPPLLRGQPGGLASIASQLWVVRLLPSSGNLEADSTRAGCALLLPQSRGRQLSCPQLTAPWKRGSPSTTTSSLRAYWSTTPRSRSLTMTLVRTPACLSAGSCSRILEREPSASQRPNNSTGRPMMAKDVEDGPYRQARAERGERETQTTKEQHPEKLWFQTRVAIRRETDERR